MIKHTWNFNTVRVHIQLRSAINEKRVKTQRADSNPIIGMHFESQQTTPVYGHAFISEFAYPAPVYALSRLWPWYRAELTYTAPVVGCVVMHHRPIIDDVQSRTAEAASVFRRRVTRANNIVEYNHPVRIPSIHLHSDGSQI